MDLYSYLILSFTAIALWASVGLLYLCHLEHRHGQRIIETTSAVVLFRLAVGWPLVLHSWRRAQASNDA